MPAERHRGIPVRRREPAWPGCRACGSQRRDCGTPVLSARAPSPAEPPSHTVAACITYGCSLVAYGCRRFLEATQHLEESDALDAAAESEDDGGDASAAQPAGRAGDGAGGGAAGAGGAALGLEVLFNHVRVAPQYSLAALRPGVFVLGMKEQLTVHDLPSHPLHEQVST